MSTLILEIILMEKDKIIVKLMKLMIASLPMSYIGLLGMSMVQIFSWYNIFLFVFMCYILNRFKSITKKSLVPLIIILPILIIQNIWNGNLIECFTEIIQVVIMLFPLTIIFNNKDKILISKDDIKQLLNTYANVCIATAIAMLIQFFLFYYANIQIGYFNFGGANRVSCFCLFKGASILPIFMGIGFLILLIDILDNNITLLKVIKISTVLLAMVLNTSRSALVMVFIITAIILVKQFYKKVSLKTIIIGATIFMGVFIGMNYIITLRSNLDGILDANGRLETIVGGIEIWTANIKNFILGIGFSSSIWKEGLVKPHNILIQTLSQCGIVVTLCIIICFKNYFYENRNNKYKYLPWFILLSFMLVTDFYANAFITVIFILVDWYGINNDKEYKMKKNMEEKYGKN